MNTFPWDHQCLIVSSILGGSALSREKKSCPGIFLLDCVSHLSASERSFENFSGNSIKEVLDELLRASRNDFWSSTS